MPGASSPLGRSLQQLAESVSLYLDVDGKKVSRLHNAGWIWIGEGRVLPLNMKLKGSKNESSNQSSDFGN